MRNPFKKIAQNAEESKNKKQWVSIKESSKTSTRICPNCGTPRPKKSDLRKCSYCNSKFMDIDTKINSDN